MLFQIIEWVHLIFDYLVEFIFGLWYGSSGKIVEAPENNIVTLSATELANRIRTRSITSEEVVQTFIDRIEKINGTINAVIDTRFPQALEEARKIDANIKAGKYTEQDFIEKPLLGVPFTSKESSRCNGMSATFALKARENCRSIQDATIIENVKRTGAILIALTNIPQLNMWIDTYNPLFGATNNPYDTTRSVGGSSGGEACLMASAGTPFSVGTDIGGSIRIPSYMCGVFGHKASNGLTCTAGLTFRDGSEKDRTMVTAGPICRHACDLALGLKVILGPESTCLKLDRPVDVKNLQYFYVESNRDLRCSPVRGDVKYGMEMVVEHLSSFATVEKLCLEEFSSSFSIYKYWLSEEKTNFALDITNKQYEAQALAELWKKITLRSEFSLSIIFLLISEQYFPKPDGKWARDITEKLRTALLDKLSVSGVLLFPSWPTAPQQHHVDFLRPFNFAYTAIFNALKLPVTQVPLGLNAQGVPIGLQVVAAPMQDRLCIAVAKHLESQFGGFVEPWRKSN